ncbi:unnamed protein product [Alopecurus aequalis]
MDPDEERSRVLVIGGTGHIGKHIVAASARHGHPTSVLIRDATPLDPAKAQLLMRFVDSGVALIKGDLFNHESLVKAIKSTDIIISAVGPVNSLSRRGLSQQSRRPTIIGDVTRVGAGPPSDKITVLGDGDAKAVFVVEEDIADYTVRATDDPRTLNKILYMRPPANIVSHNELISMWERKAGKTFQIVLISEVDLLERIKEAPYPLNILLFLALSIFVRGDQANFEIEPSFGVEATELYPDVKYTTIDEYLNRLL